MWLRDLEGFAEDGAGFVLHQEEGAVGFPLGDLLEEAQKIDICEEEAGSVVREGRLGQIAAGGEAQFIDFWSGVGRWWGRRW